MAGAVEALERGRLQLLESGVGEVRDLVVVAGEDDRVAGEVGRVAVVVEVVEVGEEEGRGCPTSTASRAASQASLSPFSKVRSSSAVPVSSLKFSSSRAVRPLNQRVGEASSRVT